jgi:hypothetical protein
MADRRSETTRLLAGYALATVGALMLGLSGLCTLSVMVGSVTQAFRGGWSNGEFPPDVMLPLGLVFGLPPILIGGLLFWIGRRLQKPRPRPSAPPPG